MKNRRLAFPEPPYIQQNSPCIFLQADGFRNSLSIDIRVRAVPDKPGCDSQCEHGIDELYFCCMLLGINARFWTPAIPTGRSQWFQQSQFVS